MTRSVCLAAAATLEFVTKDLQPGECAEFRDWSGMHMTLYVSRLRDAPAALSFAIAHAHAGHLAELIVDPSVVVLRAADGSWTPLEITTPFTHVVTAEAGDPARVVLRDEHRRLVALVNVWMRNVKANLLKRSALEGEEMCSPVAYAAG